MMRKRTPAIPWAFLTAGALFLLGGCKTNPPTTTEHARPPAQNPGRPAETKVSPQAASRPAPIQPDILAEDLQVLNKKGYLKDDFFDFDKAELRDDARAALAADSEWLKKYPSVWVLVEGHCDERGTDAYNLVLGDRRANATKEYLAALGVDVSRVKTVSYGKERPFCAESSEDCWQQNRRGHFLITGK